MTAVAVNVYSHTHSVTYVAENILKSLKDVILHSGLDPAVFVNNWELHKRGVDGWLRSGDLKCVKLDIYHPLTDELLFQWNIEISYSWTGGDGSFWTDTEQLKYAIRKAGLVPSEAKYDLRLNLKSGHREITGWGTGKARSAEGMIRQSLGTTIGHGSLSGSTSYLRRP
ncbi:HORMA domain containing protein [Bradyrhizobium sp. HKCCYLS2038]|uniref:HORMA domain containing protein n=1 Tax=unclassified Bradyrhizobium TaxID=2631580 RepID=UPI003EBC135B